MKTHYVTIFLGILLLAECTPTSAPTSVAVLPDATHTETSTDTPTDTPTDSPTNTPAPDIIVTSTADAGPGTLRQALQDARSGYTIGFDPAVFPPDAPATIYVSGEELPHIHVNNITLDASNAGVILDGSQLTGEWIAGVQIVSSEANTIMGLHISRFPGPGIAISGDSKHNMIGGDRSVGAGPYGQGNLLSNNIIGVDLATSGAALNTVTGNLIGTDNQGADSLGNERNGVSMTEGAHDNTIGPDNIIANNGHFGFYSDPSIVAHNNIIQNNIYDNGIGKGEPVYPIIFDFDLSTGTTVGATCPNCTVEIFSTSNYEGEIFEDQTTADENGVFTFNTGTPFTGPYLTVRTTNVYGRESIFSWPPTSGTERILVLQTGNDLPRRQFLLQLSGEHVDNHIASQYDGIAYTEDLSDLTIYRAGLTRARVSMAGLEPELVDWDKPEFSISQSQDDHFTRMANKGIIVTYVLMFWDKETYPDGEGAPCARFKTEGEIERFLEYVRFTVGHLKDRVQYFEIWNEPDIRGYCPKWIELTDYINLVKRTAPVIREVSPESKIVVGAVSSLQFGQVDYLFGLLESEIMPLVDVISWHPMYGVSPEHDQFRDYYYNYPAFVQSIKETATAYGFVGEYHADELTWRTTYKEDQPWVYTPIRANKYFSRAAIMHLGMDIDVGLGSGYYIIRRLSTVMAGAEPADLPIEIQSAATNIVSYSFSLPDGGYLVGVWTDGIAVEDDPGNEATLTFPDFSASYVNVIDVMNNLEQALLTETENGDLVIRNLLVKDYPILIIFSDTTP
jgi:hypothetical protein